MVITLYAMRKVVTTVFTLVCTVSFYIACRAVTTYLEPRTEK